MATRPRAWAVSILLLVTAAGCAGDEALSDREVEATRLVEAQVGEAMTCRDNGAVNTEVHPEYPVGFSCFNERRRVLRRRRLARRDSHEPVRPA
jgi:hypothetical protein